eukprot:1285412-Amphidinium_carterae.2
MNPTTPEPPQPCLGPGEIRAALVGKSSIPRPPPAKSSGSVSTQIDSSKVGIVPMDLEGFEPKSADGARPIEYSAQEAQPKPPLHKTPDFHCLQPLKQNQ